MILSRMKGSSASSRNPRILYKFQLLVELPVILLSWLTISLCGTKAQVKGAVLVYLFEPGQRQLSALLYLFDNYFLVGNG